MTMMLVLDKGCATIDWDVELMHDVSNLREVEVLLLRRAASACTIFTLNYVYSPHAIPVHVTMYSSQVLLKCETPMEIMVEVRWKGICRNKENGVQ